jgi:hypothetical protein
MKSFRLVPASEEPRREFKSTLGLRAGYGSAGRIYDLEEAVRTAHRWMWERRRTRRSISIRRVAATERDHPGCTSPELRSGARKAGNTLTAERAKARAPSAREGRNP